MAEQVSHLQDEKKGAWSPEEDKKLIDYTTKYGIWNWSQMPKPAGLSRSGKSCRLRWMNYVRPNLKRGPINPEETQTVIKIYQSLGNRWSAIAKELPGRTDNEIKNFYHTHLKKRLGTKVEVKPKSRKKPKQIAEMSQKDQSLDFTKSSSSSHITFDKKYDLMETSDQDNDVTSLVNQVDDLLESNTSSAVDLLIKELTDPSVDVYNCWLGLYRAANNLKP